MDRDPHNRSYLWIRWLAVVPCALLATFIVQIGSEVLFRYVLVATIGYESWIPWAAKAIAAVFMGSIFIWVAWTIAPHSKGLVSAVALCAVTVWAGSLIVRSFEDGNPEWLLVMGVCGVLGGLLAFVLAGRFSRL